MNLFHLGEGFQPGEHPGPGARFNRDKGRCADRGAHRGPEFDGIARDGAIGFETVKPGLKRGAREAQFAGQCGERRAGVFSQGRQQAMVYFVYLRCHYVNLPLNIYDIGVMMMQYDRNINDSEENRGVGHERFC